MFSGFRKTNNKQQKNNNKQMKKIIATLSLAVLTSIAAFGQGQIAFANGGTSLISTNAVSNGSATGLTAVGANGFYYALFYSTTGTTVGTMTLLGSLGTNTATLGRMTGGTGSANSPALTGITGGTAVNFRVVGWSANLGTSWSQASANNTAGTTLDAGPGWYGVSGLGNLTVGGGGSPTAIPTLMGTTVGLTQITGFTLNLVSPVPEPGTMALAALGGASLLLLRRKK
jgi:hypothetical protein